MKRTESLGHQYEEALYKTIKYMRACPGSGKRTYPTTPI